MLYGIIHVTNADVIIVINQIVLIILGRSWKMNEPNQQEIIRVLKYLNVTWKHNTEIKYVLDRYEEVSQINDEVKG